MEGSLRPQVPVGAVSIREVGPRDGLQSEAPVPVEARAGLISMLSRTGLRRIEAVSFVSPRAVPAMADAAEVWRRVERSPVVRYSALVPNRRGAEAALEAGGFASLQAFLAASDGYNFHNVGKSVEESIRDVREVAAVAGRAGVPVECSISATFGDPFGGDVDPRRVGDVAARLSDDGVEGVSLGDTTGMATPPRVWTVIEELRRSAPTLRVNLHLHDTRGTAMANALAALEIGVDDFDASVGGLGGSPFAPGAGGNVATEDLVHMLEDMGISTGVSLQALLDVGARLAAMIGHPVPSHVSRAGPRWSVAT